MTQQDASTRAESSTKTSTRELDSRTSDGVEVRLLWQPRDNRVSVAVNDSKIGVTFEVDGRPGQRALDVFHHAYAYATQPLLSPLKQGTRRLAPPLS